MRISSSLLLRVILTLATVGLLPLAITFYQVRSNAEALVDQLLKTHTVVAQATADQLAARIAPLRAAAHALAASPRIREGRTRLAQELLVAKLQEQPQIAVLGVYNTGGEVVLQVRRPGSELGEIFADAPPFELVQPAGGGRWLRIVEPMDELGWIVVAADVEPFEELIESDRQRGREAQVVVADTSGNVLFGELASLESFPEPALRLALSRRTSGGANRYQGQGLEVVVGHDSVGGAPWVVLTRQPASIAEAARQRMQTTAWIAAGLALALTVVLSHLAFLTVVRPLRRLVRAQQSLIGGELVGDGSEIAQLEAAFEVLEQRVRDRAELDKVFLGRYQVVDVLGSGAMGTVFKGYDPKLERSLALKTIRLETAGDKREKLISTLLREATTSSKFHHPNIVTVYDVADEGRAAFLAMELVEGQTLEDLIEARGIVGWRDAVPLAAAIARGLAEAHRQGLVHQDIKPANVLLGREGSVKVTDFGISQLISAASAERDVICGTPGYIAPECLEGQGYTPQSDLFALGVLLHECLSGDHPFAGKTLRVTILNTLTQEPPALERLHPDLPPELAGLIGRLLEKDPGRRLASAESVADELDALAARHGLAWRYQPVPSRGEAQHAATQRLETRVLSLAKTRDVARRASR